MAVHEPVQAAPETDGRRAAQSSAIECRALCKSFAGQRVLDGVDLRIPAGEITVVLGPSGTGKSVLAKHLVGLLFPDSGEVLVRGRSITQMRRSELLVMRRRFGILFQDGALFGSMPVYDNVALPLRQHTNLTEDEIRAVVMERLREVGLADAAPRLPKELSGGMRKRAGFARALAMDPDVVLFDEPDSGLDPVRTALLCDLIERVHEDRHATFIVITHDIRSARRIGDHIAVLWQGRIVEQGPAAAMLDSEDPFVRQFLDGATAGPLGME